MTRQHGWKSHLAVVAILLALFAAMAPRTTAAIEDDDPEGVEIPVTVRRFDFPPFTVNSDFPYEAFGVRWAIEFASVPGASEYLVRFTIKSAIGTSETFESIHPEAHGFPDDVTFAVSGAPFASVTAPAGVHWVGVWGGVYPVIYPESPASDFQARFVGARVFVRRPCDLVTSLVTVTDDVPVGEEFEVRTRIQADLSDGTGSITNIDWTPLEISPADLVEVVSGPTPPDIPSDFALESGDGFERSYVLRVVAPGTLTLSSSASGVCPSGDPVTTLPQPREIRLTSDVLDVKVELDPAVIDLEEDENATPIPQDVLATVSITNIHDQPLEAVRLIDLRARPREIPPPLPVPLAVIGGPFSPAGPLPDPTQLGTLAPGETVVRTYSLRAQAAGTVDVTAYASAALQGGTDRLTASGTTKIDIKDDVLFVLDADIESVGYRGAEPIVPGGSSWRVVGTIENRSKEETLVVQLSPELVGNASYAQPIPDGTSAPDAQCAVGIVRELVPEEVVTFRAPVRTAENGGTRGIVTYRPRVWIKGEGNTRTLIHDERASPALIDDRVVVTDGSGKHTVRVDTSDEIPRQPFADEVVGHFLVGTVDGLGSFAEGIWSLVELAGKAAVVILSPWDYPERFSRGMHLLSDLLTTILRGLSDLDREEFFAEVRAGLEAAGIAWDQVNVSIEQKFTTLTTAWETGDSATVARFWGEIAGENPDVAIGFAFGVCKLAAKGARYAGRGLAGFKASEAAALEARIAAGVRALKPWDDIGAAARATLFGIDPWSDDVLKKFAAKGFVIAVRRRGSRAIAKLRSGNFLTKPYHLKAKNVSDIDADWLGFPRDRLDEVLIKEPPPWSEVRARLVDQEPAVAAEVRLRWEKRAEEWWGKGVDDAGMGGDFATSERAQWLLHKENGIPYNKSSIEGLVDNFEDGFVPPEDLEQVLKQFETEPLTGTDGREVLAAKIEGKGVTGDIDPMYVGRPDGRGFQDLTDAERLEVYKLFRDLGFQHPESATWKNKKVKEYFEEFSIYNPNREAMALYHPDGRVVAAFFDWNKSWFDPAAWRNFYMFFRGGTTMLRSEDPDVPGLAAALQEDIRLAGQPRAVYVGPGTWALVSPDCPGGGTVQTFATGGTCPCQVSFNTAPDALVLRQSGIGTFERWTAYDGWKPYVPPDPALSITPQTYLADLAPAGSTRLAIGDLATMGFDPAAHEWFQPGQTIVINPGGATEETATIAGLGSLILTAPLRFTHPPRETVAVVGAAQTIRPDERLLSGHLLLLSQNPRKAATRRAQVVSKDRPQLALGSDGDVAALRAADGWLRVRAAGDGGFDVTYPLPAGGWKPLKARKPAKGLKHAGHGPITKVVLTAGKQLSVTVKGSALAVDLATKPGPIQVELALGARRYCLEFGGRERFKAGKRLLRQKASRAATCPPS